MIFPEPDHTYINVMDQTYIEGEVLSESEISDIFKEGVQICMKNRILK